MMIQHGLSMPSFIPAAYWLRAAEQMGPSVSQAQQAYFRKCYDTYGLTERYRGQLVNVPWSSTTAAPLARSGVTAFMKQEVYDAQGQGELERAQKIWDDSMEVTGNQRIDVPVNATRLAYEAANRIIQEVNEVLEKETHGTVSAPFDLLMGSLLLMLNYDSDPSDNFGWPNAAAIPGQQGIGIILFGRLTPQELVHLEHPELARSVIWHEFGHLVEGRLNPYSAYIGDTGAMKEFFADLFAIYMMQQVLYREAMPGIVDPKINYDAYSRWLVGNDFIKGDRPEQMQGLRHYYGLGHVNHALLGTDNADHDWPIKSVAAFKLLYRKVWEADRCGVHLNSSAFSNVAFHQVMGFRGQVEPAIKIAALAIALSFLHKQQHLTIKGFAQYQLMAAKILVKHGRVPSDAVSVVAKAWKLKEINLPLNLTDEGMSPQSALATYLKLHGSDAGWNG